MRAYRSRDATAVRSPTASCAPCSRASCRRGALFAPRLRLARWRGRFAPAAWPPCPAIGPKLAAMLALAPKSHSRGAAPAEKPGVRPPTAAGRAAAGAAHRLRPGRACARRSTPRRSALLNRAGIEVVIPQGEGCCGSLPHHMGRETEGARPGARQHRRVDARDRRRRPGGDRHHRVGLRRDDQGLRLPARATTRPTPKKAARVAALARDVDRICRRPRSRLRRAAAARRRLSRRLLAAARAEDRRPAQGAAPPRRLRRPQIRPRRISAAARPGPTTSSSPRSPPRCASARSPTSSA